MNDSPDPICEICGASDLVDLRPMEMMHGQDGPFHYLRCQACETIYQPKRLADYGKYYPNNYYSFRYEEPTSFSAKLRQMKRRLRNQYYYFSTGLVGKFLSIARPRPTNHLASNVKLNKDMSILEIGSGTGELLHELADLTISKVVGIDPYIPTDIRYSNGAQVFKIGISEIAQRLGTEKFDLIMFNHSLEHSPTPVEDLEQIKNYLKPQGKILIRIPVSGSTIASDYGKYWWSLDAPRHIYIFSAKSLPLLAQKCGLRVTDMHFEGTVDDFLASEQHKAGISLLSPNSYVVSKNFSTFTKEQMKVFESSIQSQNKDGTAAQAGFILEFSA